MHTSSFGKLSDPLEDPFKVKINERADRDYVLIGEGQWNRGFDYQGDLD